MARARRRKACSSPNADMNGKPLRVGDRVRVGVPGWRNAANDGYPPHGVITKWDGCNVAEVRAPKAKTSGGYGVNYDPGGRYSISTNQLTRVGRARRR